MFLYLKRELGRFKERVRESKDYYRREKMLRIAVVEDHPRMQRGVCGYIEKVKE